MPRKKVKLAWIGNNALRRRTFKKRLLGLFKKLSEITTLCDVQACGIVCGSTGTEPEVWPSVPEARRMVRSFLELPEIEQYKKMTNQQSFLQVRANKLANQYQRSGIDIHELELCMFLYEYLCGHDMNELNHNDAMTVFCYADRRERMIYNLLDAAKAKDGRSWGNASNELIEHPPGIQHVLPNIATTSNVVNTATNDFPDAASNSLNEQTMFPQNIGMGNANQWIYPNPFGPFN